MELIVDSDSLVNVTSVVLAVNNLLFLESIRVSVASCNSQLPERIVVSVRQDMARDVDGSSDGFKMIRSGQLVGKFDWANDLSKTKTMKKQAAITLNNEILFTIKFCFLVVLQLLATIILSLFEFC